MTFLQWLNLSLNVGVLVFSGYSLYLTRRAMAKRRQEPFPVPVGTLVDGKAELYLPVDDGATLYVLEARK